MNEIKQIIDLQALLADQRVFQSVVDDRTRELNKANEVLSSFNSRARLEIKTSLNYGATTGDSLQDEIIQCYGLDKQAIDRIMAFNRRLVAAKGEELLIAIPYEIQWKHGSETRPDDFHPCWGRIFGTLSGERLQIATGPSLSLTIPFTRHLIRDFDGEPCKVKNGPAVLVEKHYEPNPMTILNEVTRTGRMTIQDYLALSSKKCGRTTLILLGEEITWENIAKIDCMVSPENLRAILKTATDDEVIQAENI
jgi:hypothetical protein